VSSDEEIEREIEAIVAAHGKDLERYLGGTMKLAEDMAGEVINDALLAIVQKRRKNQIIDNVRSYLFRVAKNAAIDHLRRRYVSGIPASETIDDWFTRRNPLEDAESELELNRIISALPLRQRQVLVLRRLYGYTGRETAEILGISEGTIGPTLMVAEQRLGPLLMKHLEVREEVRHEPR
jgi:RNA polymerase sigma factor (sigma-70 family)